MLASGSGTNLQALLDAYPENLVVVAGDKKEAFAFERARRAGVPVEHVDPAGLRRQGGLRPGARGQDREPTTSGSWWGPGTCGYCRRSSWSVSPPC